MTSEILLIGSAVGIVIIALLGWLLFKGRRQDEIEDDRGEEADAKDDAATVQDEPKAELVSQPRVEAPEPPTTSATADDPPADKFMSTLPQIPNQSGPQFRRRAETGIAVQDLDDAREDLPDVFADLEALFRQTLAARPEQIDVRLKLLEICHSMGDVDKFMAEAMIIHEMLGDEPDDRWKQVKELGLTLLPTHPLFAREDPVQGVGSTGGKAKHRGRHYDLVARDKLDPAIAEFNRRYSEFRADRANYRRLIRDIQITLSRPSPLSLLWPAGSGGGAAIYLKKEYGPANQSVAINACGQFLLAQKLGYTRVITAGRSLPHVQSMAELVKEWRVPCTIFLDAQLAQADPKLADDLEAGGMSVETVMDPSKDCRVPALNEFSQSKDALYLSDLGGGPAPYPRISRDFQGLIGLEINRQLHNLRCGRPEALVMAYESGQAGLGLLMHYLDDQAIRMYCTTQFVEHRGTGRSMTTLGIEMRGAREHAWLRALGRVEYREISNESVAALFSQFPDIPDVPRSVENGRALALARDVAVRLPETANIILMLADSSRGAEHVDWDFSSAPH